MLTLIAALVYTGSVFLAGLMVGKHNAAHLAADVAVAKSDLALIKAKLGLIAAVPTEAVHEIEAIAKPGAK